MESMYTPSMDATRAAVIHIALRGETRPRSPQAELEEALGLAQAISLDVVHQEILTVKAMSPALLIGKGQAENLSQTVSALDIKLVIINHALTPIHHRNLERVLKCKVIDRTGLILEIFGDRAQTAEGRMQVELAALKHQRSRLVRSWTHLERQRGGFGFTGGPGEKQIELDRRLIDSRIIKLEKDLAQVKRTRALHRQSRQRALVPVVALVGYTNAGKSTLFNYLTQAGVMAQDLLFATLDPTMRPVKLPSGREVIFSDTVGFISDLPTQLVAAFRATLEEVCNASLILHVQDASHPDREAQAADVHKVLAELDIDTHSESTQPFIIDVYNKIDLLSCEAQDVLHNQISRQANAVCISAQTGAGMERLLDCISQQLNREGVTKSILIPSTRSDILAWCYRQGIILSRYDKDAAIHLTLRLTPQTEAKLNQML